MQSQALWNEFAENKREIRDQHNDDHKRYGFAVRRDSRDLVELGRQTVRKRSLAVGSH